MAISSLPHVLPIFTLFHFKRSCMSTKKALKALLPFICKVFAPKTKIPYFPLGNSRDTTVSVSATRVLGCTHVQRLPTTCLLKHRLEWGINSNSHSLFECTVPIGTRTPLVRRSRPSPPQRKGLLSPRTLTSLWNAIIAAGMH